MKFIVSSGQLLRALQTVSGVIQSNNTLPILDHFLVHLDPGKLTITASDLETTMTTHLSVDSSESTDKWVVIVVSRSDAVIVNFPGSR